MPYRRDLWSPLEESRLVRYRDRERARTADCGSDQPMLMTRPLTR